MPDAVRQDDVITGCVEKLSRSKQDVRKLRRKKLRSRAAGAVSNQNGVVNEPGAVAGWRPNRAVMNS